METLSKINAVNSVELLVLRQYRAKLLVEWLAGSSLTAVSRQNKIHITTLKKHLCEYVGESVYNELVKRQHSLKMKSVAVAGIVKPTPDGYLRVITPHNMSNKTKHVLLHHAVFCTYYELQTCPRGHVVHHIDHNKLNNSIENLILMSVSEHNRLHSYKTERVTTSRETYTQASGKTAPLLRCKREKI